MFSLWHLFALSILLAFPATASAQPSCLAGTSQIAFCAGPLSSKCGVVDSNGTVVVPFVYDNIGHACYERIAITTEGKTGYLDLQGRGVVAPKYAQAGSFRYGFAFVKNDRGKGQFVSPDGAELTDFLYDYGEFTGNYARVAIGSKVGCIDSTGRVVLAIDYARAECADDVWMFCLNARRTNCGLMAPNSVILLPPKFAIATLGADELIPISAGEGGEQRAGYVKRDGSIAIPLTFHAAFHFDRKHNVASVILHPRPRDADYRYSLIDRLGNVIGPAENGSVRRSSPYDEYVSPGKLVAFQRSERWGFIDTKGVERIPPIYLEVRPFFDGIAAASTGTWGDHRWGFIDGSGRELIPPQYIEVHPYSGGIGAVNLGTKTHPLWEVVDTAGKLLGDGRFRAVWPLHDGMAVVANADSTHRQAALSSRARASTQTDQLKNDLAKYGLIATIMAQKGEHPDPEHMRDVKWGYINGNGEVIVSPSHDAANHFNSGFATVRDGNLWTVLNKAGKVLFKIEGTAPEVRRITK